MNDLKEILSLFQRNAQKLQTNLSAYHNEVDTVLESLMESWSHVGRADRRIISVHDGLLSSVSEVNEYVIKLNLHINLNRSMGIYKNVKPNEQLCNFEQESLDQSVMNVAHKNLDGIDVGELDVAPHVAPLQVAPSEQLQLSPSEQLQVTPSEQLLVEPSEKLQLAPSEQQQLAPSEQQQLAPSEQQQVTPNEQLHVALKQTDNTSIKQANESVGIDRSVSSSPAAPAITPVLPIPPRQTMILPPKGGKQMSIDYTYNHLLKNISSFVKDSIVLATMMHLNIAENCIFIGKWEQDTAPLKKLLAGQMPMQELQRLPDYGEIFAVYDAQEQIIPRVLINALSEGGGYDAYLVDYGEHIHLDGKEVIFALSNDVQMLPAEAIRCFVRNRDAASMNQFIYNKVLLRVLENNGNELEVEFLEDGQTGSSINLASTEKLNSDCKAKEKEQEQEQPKEQIHSAVSDKVLVEAKNKLSPEDKAMLEHIEHGTSDPVKAVLGFNPTDDKRICRHYDPKINGCFKGSNCRLLHQPFAPHGATKDTELVDALPESIYVSSAARSVGSVVRVMVTYIKSPTQVYVQFVDNLPPLVWNRKDVPEAQRKFKRTPRVLDMVMALYSDNCYYRAQIIEVVDRVFQIFYVDYGNTEFVTLKSLAQCNDACSLKPHRAVSCFIEGIDGSSVVSHRRSVECVEFLKSKILNATFNVLLINHLPDAYVIKFLDRYAEVPKQMIKRGYVEPNYDDLELSGNSAELV